MLVSMFCVIAFTCHIFGSSPVTHSVSGSSCSSWGRMNDVGRLVFRSVDVHGGRSDDDDMALCVKDPRLCLYSFTIFVAN